MQLMIKQRNVKLFVKEKEEINRRFLFCFSRLSEVVKQVTLTLEDINGPKGGVDKQCKVQVSFIRGKDLVLTERQSEFRYAIERALQRASYNAVQSHKRKNMISYKTYNLYSEPENRLGGELAQ